MRINVHTHVFNLRAILTRGTIDIIKGRLVKDDKVPFFRDAVGDLLNDVLPRVATFNEDEVARLLLAKLTARPEFSAYLKSLGGTLPVDVRLALEAGVEHLGADAISALTHKLTGLLHGAPGDAEEDAAKTDFYDILAMIQLAAKHEIRDIASVLLAPLGPEDLIVTLMLDICDEANPDNDREEFDYQLRATSEAALVFPGRVLPFVSVSPRRANFMATVERAIGSMGFVGVKLYPSLGYRIDTPDMKPLFDYCAANDVPLLMHCNQGGFFKDQASTENCNPALWEPILGAPGRENLRICFAHCGGDDFVASADFGRPSWSTTILGLMARYQGVYADIAFHTAPMDGDRDPGPRPETTYFENLKKILDDPALGERVLFGSDAWLVRQRVSEENYWAYFTRRLSPAHFAQITDTNPRRFLGLADAGRPAIGRNIGRHVDFLAANRERVWSAPTRWVSDAIGVRFPAGVTFRVGGAPAWSRNNAAHVATFAYLKENQFTGAQSGVKFADAGAIPLFRLGYWTKGHGADDEFARRCGTVARGLMRTCEAMGAVLERDVDPDKTVESLTGILQKGTATIAELAAELDLAYHFREEP